MFAKLKAFDAWLRDSDVAKALTAVVLFWFFVGGSAWLFGVCMVNSRDHGGPRATVALSSLSLDQAVGVFFGLAFVASLCSALIAVFANDLLRDGLRAAARHRRRVMARCRRDCDVTVTPNDKSGV